MAAGWAGDGVVQDQIDATVKDGAAVLRVGCLKVQSLPIARAAKHRFRKRVGLRFPEFGCA